MDFEYHSICMNITLIHITLLIVRYAYVSDSFSQGKTVPGTYIWTKNQVSEFCNEKSNIFIVQFILNECWTYQNQSIDC